MSQQRRALERKIWATLKAEGKIPDTSTRAGRAAYAAMQREVQKQVAKQPQRFRGFELQWETAWEELNRPAEGWFKRKKNE